MAMLLASFDIVSAETPDGEEAQERMAVTMTPVGLRMRLREDAEPGHQPSQGKG